MGVSLLGQKLYYINWYKMHTTSMMQKHHLQIQEDQERQVVMMLAAISPDVGKKGRQCLIEESSFNINVSYNLINQFKEYYLNEIKVWSNERLKKNKLITKEIKIADLKKIKDFLKNSSQY